jgi:ribosomal protein S18 acetylase RimI-like enzyme
VIAFRPFQRSDSDALARAWDRCARSQPNPIPCRAEELQGRVFEQAPFDAQGLIVAAQGEELAGFVHFGPRLDLWLREGAAALSEEGQIRLLATPDTEEGLARDLLGQAEEQLLAAGAQRILLGPSWVQGGQPFWNGIAGAYEIPGLSVLGSAGYRVARELGYTQFAEYGTPELSLTAESVAQLASEARAGWVTARGWGIQVHERRITSPFFPPRRLVELLRGRRTVATAAYGEWPEYERHYRRKLLGITSVQVAPSWRGKGLGKLVMQECLLACYRAGAAAAHLHVWRENEVAWNLYHRALGFQPGPTWVTMVREK